MPMSPDQFREALKRADMRSALGLQLSDDDAQRVADDPASTRSWYDYWLSIQPAPAQATPPPPPQFTGSPAAQYPGAPAQDAQPTMAYASNAMTVGIDPGPPSFATSQYAGIPSDGATAKKRNVGLWVTLSIIGALLLIIAIVVVTAFTTARHWTKVDVPEQPETFHSEEYETGRYDVSMDTVNPCYVNQDWTDCTNLLQASYDANCAGVELTETATAICADYSSAIGQMRAQDSEGAYVATLGTYGNLTRTPEIDTRQVSNDDYRPAETHEAVCYLGFLGECE